MNNELVVRLSTPSNLCGVVSVSASPELAASRMRPWIDSALPSLVRTTTTTPAPEQELASADEEEEYKKNALYRAQRGLTTLLPGTRTLSTAPLPQVGLSDLVTLPS